MSSQWSSSIRAISGIAFRHMLGEPLSRDVSTPSASFTESEPKVASYPVDRRAMKPAHEAASVSGQHGNEEVEEVMVSYGDLQSLITPEDCTRITREYGVKVVEPTDIERPHTPRMVT